MASPQARGRAALAYIDRFLGVSAPLAATLLLMRVIVDTATRIAYPFIPQFAAGLGIGVVGFGWLISLRSAVGLAGPLLGAAADRFGKKALMLFGLGCVSLGYLGMFALSGWMVAAPMALIGLGTASFVPAQQAYISDQAAPDRRGRALAAVDVSFAVTGVVVLPMMGWLIQAYDWRAPFAVMGGLCVAAGLVAWRRLPPTAPTPHARGSVGAFKSVLARPNVVAVIATAALLFFAYSNYLTVWSVWLNARFGLTAADMGVVATAIGLAELAGVILAGLFIDRIGKRRGETLGLLGAAVLLAAWALAQQSQLAGIATIVALGGVFEYAIIALFPLVAEQQPESRATVFALMGVGASVGLAAGAPAAAALWEGMGVIGVCATAGAALLAAAGVVSRWMLESSRHNPRRLHGP